MFSFVQRPSNDKAYPNPKAQSCSCPQWLSKLQCVVQIIYDSAKVCTMHEKETCTAYYRTWLPFASYASNSPPHEVLQHRRLSRALSTDHRYLGEVDGTVLTELGEGILKLVHNEDQLLHPRVVERHLLSSCLAYTDLGRCYTMPNKETKFRSANRRNATQPFTNSDVIDRQHRCT